MKRACMILLLLVLMETQTLAGQTRLPSPGTRTAVTTLAGPSKISATVYYATVTLYWMSVNGASGYRITRVNNTGEAERVIYEGPRGDFSTFNGTFTPSLSTEVTCRYTDGDPSWWCRHKDPDLPRGILYSYRVYALFENGVVSPPSAVASVLVP